MRFISPLQIALIAALPLGLACSETIDAPFSSASDVPINAASFTGTGHDIQLSLLFDPAPGTELTVVNNTGVSPISGEFSNLAHGQRVVLPYGAKRYPFVASYQGGDGNDLVLIWSRQAAVWLRTDSPVYGEQSRGGIESASGHLKSFFRTGGILADHTPVEFRVNNFQQATRLADGTWATWTWDGDLPAALEMSGPLAGKKIKSLILGDYHFLALCEDASLVAWGKNDSGQIGNGVASQITVNPIDISGAGALAGKTVVSVAAGYHHSLALCSDGSLVAWGNNTYGQLGTSDTIQYTSPTAVTMTGALAGKTVSRIFASDFTSAALCSDGTVYTWGYNADGMLGNGLAENASQPIAVVTSGALSGKSVVDLALSSYHTLALCSDQSLASWGRNNHGVLGDGTNSSSRVPVTVAGLNALGGEPIVAISAGDDQSFLLTAPGRVFGWGRANGGNLGTASGNGGYTPGPLSLYGDLAGSRVMQLPTWSVGSSIVALPLKSDASLAGLSLDSATLEQDILPSLHQYVAALRSGATEVRLTPLTNDPDALVAVNGVPVENGVSSLPIAVTPGSSTVTIRVTAQDGSTSDYTVDLVASPTLNLTLQAESGPGISMPAYDATGNTASISLGHVPVAGSVFTLIENTGNNFIGGRFTNLAQGQILELPFNGLIYRFAVNYHGGNGNDLVLEWASRKLAAWGGVLGDGSSNTSLVPLEPYQAGVLAGKSVASVSVGLGHCLALCSDGAIVSWGKNDSGQLGNGTFENSLVPVEVDRSGAMAGRQVVAIRAGSSHSLALCSDGKVFAWGENFNRQLGDGTGTDRALPVAVPLDPLFPSARVTSITSGANHSAVLFSNGRVAVWGDNQGSQLGPSVVNSAKLIPMAGPLATRTVRSIVAGYDNTFVQCADGSIWGWGNNRRGGIVELVGPTVGQPDPVELTALAAAASGPIRQIAAGLEYALALDSAGKVFSWGHDHSYQLAQSDPNYSSYSKPLGEATKIAPLLAGDTVGKLVAKYATSVAITSSGKAIIWGDGTSGKLGNGTNPFGGSLPVKVDTSGVLRDQPIMQLDVGTNVVAVVAVPPNTLLKSFAISTGIQDQTFDWNQLSYRLNVASATSALIINAVPEYPHATVRINGMVADPSGFTLPVAPGLSQVAVEVSLEDGSSRTYSIDLLTDIHHTFTSSTDIALSFPGYHAGGRTTGLSLGFEPRPGSALTVLENTGIGFIDGEFQNLAQWQTVTLSFEGKDYDFVANYHGGDGNDLVLEWAHRELALWGPDSLEALANGPAGSSKLPAAPTNPGALAGRTILSISAGQGHSAALCKGGEVVVWGMATAVQSATPKLISGTGALAGREVIAISAALNNALALCSDGTIVAWGSNSYGQLGNGTTSASIEPVEVNRAGVLAGKSIVAISCGGTHCLALDSDGAVYAWGRGNRYQLGRNSTANATTPIAVRTTSPSALQTRRVKAIATGFEHSLALCTDGALVGWGSNSHGQLASTSGMYPTVIPASGALFGKTIVAISQGAENYTLVLCSDGSVVGWGKNDVGQLGTAVGSPTSNVPVAVVTSGVLAGKTVSSISSGNAHSIAVCSDGSVVTWGTNSAGERGDGTSLNHRPPVLPDMSGALYGRYGIRGAAGLHTMVVVAKPKDGFIDFMSGFPGMINQTENGDSDGDGLPNLVEFLLASHPATPTGERRPVFFPSHDESVFSFLRNPSSIGNTTQSFEWSDDLKNWNSIPLPAASTGNVTVSPTDENGLQPIKISLPAPSSGHRFGRLKVTRP